MATRKGIPTVKQSKPRISTKGTTVRAGTTGAVRKGRPR